MTDFGLSKKSVIVTGAAGGLGPDVRGSIYRPEPIVTIADVDEAGAQAPPGHSAQEQAMHWARC